MRKLRAAVSKSLVAAKPAKCPGTSKPVSASGFVRCACVAVFPLSFSSDFHENEIVLLVIQVPAVCFVLLFGCSLTFNIVLVLVGRLARTIVLICFALRSPACEFLCFCCRSAMKLLVRYRRVATAFIETAT